MARILTVTSGKGGVGKTNVSVNLAVHLAQQGHRTCLFDADLGLANINILLGIYPEDTLEDVIEGRKNLKDIVIHDKNGIDIIPGSSGVAKMEALSTLQLNSLASAFGQLDPYDFFVFDTSAGVSKNVIAFCMSASEVILVITPEPTSLTDAYALMKVLSLNGFKQQAKVVVNQSKNPKTSQIAFTKLKDTVRKFLGIQLTPLGTITADARVIEAVAAQQPFISLYPNTQASKNLKTIISNLLDKDPGNDKVFTMDTFWHRCVDVFTAPLKMPAKKAEAAKKKETVTPPKPAVTKAKSTPVTPVSSDSPSKATPLDAQKANAKAPTSPTDQQSKLMEKLIEKVSAVSEELSGIRQVLEKGAGVEDGSESTKKSPGAAPPLIPLDFEAFLDKQERSGEKDGDS